MYRGNFGGNNAKGEIKTAVLSKLELCVVLGDIILNCCRLYMCVLNTVGTVCLSLFLTVHKTNKRI